MSVIDQPFGMKAPTYLPRYIPRRSRRMMHHLVVSHLRSPIYYQVPSPNRLNDTYPGKNRDTEVHKSQDSSLNIPPYLPLYRTPKSEPPKSTSLKSIPSPGLTQASRQEPRSLFHPQSHAATCKKRKFPEKISYPYLPHTVQYCIGTINNNNSSEPT